MSNEEQSSGSAALEKRKSIVPLIVILILLVGGIFGLNTIGIIDIPRISQDVSVAAVVNGIEITEQQIDDRIDRLRDLPQTAGLDLTDPTVRSQVRDQVLEELIDTQLILADAEVRNISISDEEIEIQYQQLAEEAGGEEALLELLEMRGFPLEKFKNDIWEQMMLQTYMTARTAEKDIVISEDEITETYETLRSSNEDLAPLEEIRGEIEDALSLQKTQLLINEILTELRSNAAITIGEEE